MLKHQYLAYFIVFFSLAANSALGCKFCNTPNVKSVAPAPAAPAPAVTGGTRLLPSIQVGSRTTFSDDFFSGVGRAPAEAPSERGTYITTTPVGEIYGN